MAYHTAEYRRDTEDRDNKQGGWRSWFGLDNKDREEDRGYSYSNTTTYRNPNPTSYGYSSAPHPERSGFSGPISSGTRGGYGYTTSDEVRPSWNTDRDYNTRAGYGQDRDVYYKQETRTYGGDNTPYTPYRPTTSRDYPTTRDYTYTRDYPTTRPYGFSADREETTRYNTERSPSRGYTTGTYGYTAEHPTSRTYPVTGDRDWNTPSYRTTGDRDWNTPSYRTTGDRDWNTPSRYGFSADRDVTSRGYGYNTRDTDYPTRSYGYDSRPYNADRDYNRASYEKTSYRY